MILKLNVCAHAYIIGFFGMVKELVYILKQQQQQQQSFNVGQRLKSA